MPSLIKGADNFDTSNNATQTELDTSEQAAKDYADSIALGVGQTWQDLTASRSFSTTYTNTSGRAIAVSVTGVRASGTYGVSIIVDGLEIGSQYISGSGAASIKNNVFAIVQDGSTYRAEENAAATLLSWKELR